jgi:hypothetical protein
MVITKMDGRGKRKQENLLEAHLPEHVRTFPLSRMATSAYVSPVAVKASANTKISVFESLVIKHGIARFGETPIITFNQAHHVYAVSNLDRLRVLKSAADLKHETESFSVPLGGNVCHIFHTCFCTSQQ